MTLAKKNNNFGSELQLFSWLPSCQRLGHTVKLFFPKFWIRPYDVHVCVCSVVNSTVTLLISCDWRPQAAHCHWHSFSPWTCRAVCLPSCQYAAVRRPVDLEASEPAAARLAGQLKHLKTTPGGDLFAKVANRAVWQTKRFTDQRRRFSAPSQVTSRLRLLLLLISTHIIR